MKKKVIRKWLNPPTSPDSGWIHFDISSQCDGVDCSLTIADCGRQITLDISASKHRYSPRNKKQALKKLDLLITALQDIRKEYPSYYADYLIKEAEWKLKHKANPNRILNRL